MLWYKSDLSGQDCDCRQELSTSPRACLSLILSLQRAAFEIYHHTQVWQNMIHGLPGREIHTLAQPCKGNLCKGMHDNKRWLLYVTFPSRYMWHSLVNQWGNPFLLVSSRHSEQFQSPTGMLHAPHTPTELAFHSISTLQKYNAGTLRGFRCYACL